VYEGEFTRTGGTGKFTDITGVGEFVVRAAASLWPKKTREFTRFGRTHLAE
jgi:hypothetical protein